MLRGNFRGRSAHGMAYDGFRCIEDSESKLDKREKGIILFPAVDCRSATKADIKSRPYSERGTAKCHVRSDTDTAEVGDLEPIGIAQIYDPMCSALARVRQ